ncbi:probable potential formate transporter [marine gamma proteobacterium HTCC2143]|jgi:formate/nitrite transporter FocA (FNT family)|uniref:Probable potential formate transporter n=1 Tax=marine gamma proteobacterium HTCC2143 TaxID=247633 RepID=A0YFW5_9GAMM|nr:probable potential formate transporter [marine gamma proteobacterium HTCC2143]
MFYIKPAEFVKKMVDAGEQKIFMSSKDTFIRAFMAGAILGLAAVFAITVGVKTESPLLGAMLFPVGFIMLYLLFPFSTIVGGKFTLYDYLIWNEVPTVIGNLVGGLVFVALPLYFTHVRTALPPHKLIQ